MLKNGTWSEIHKMLENSTWSKFNIADWVRRDA